MRLWTAMAIGLALLPLAPGTAGAQELRMLEGLFNAVNSVTFSVHGGRLLGSADARTAEGVFGVRGLGTEVFLNLRETETSLLELALGTSYLEGFRAAAETLDLRGAVRSVPTIAVYSTLLRPFGADAVQPFVGASFGLTELWNAQAYDPQGTRYAVRGQTYDQGVAAGLHLNAGPLAGLFVETSFKRRKFFSLEWALPSGESRVPEGWPRAMNLSTWLLSAGWQFDIAK